MKKQIYLQNIKFLINSNFLFLESLNDKSKRKNNEVKFSFLDISQYLKNIKQLTRTLQFLRNQTNSSLYLEKDIELIYLIKKKSKISLKTFNKFLFGVNKKESSDKASKFYLSTSEFSFKDKYFKFLFFHKLYMITSINSNFEKYHLGTYKFYNDLTEIKKQMFFLLILKRNI